ncbi:MAG TPA: AarF/UbiB family protein [Mariniphaga sp.]|nr:AarF/UbiB family protein [Mariniphaga sp.]
MKFRKKVEHIKRYKDLAWLLYKYGQSDIVKKMDIPEPEFEEDFAKDSKAEDLPNDLEKLGPTYVKLGQFLSTRADFLPPRYLKELTRLQDKVQPIPADEMERILTNELDTRISKAFEHFEYTPLASASLGQVHFAQLRGGKPVAVKIQRPNIREQIFDDLDAFQDITDFLEKHTALGKQLMIHATLEEFRKAITKELDYLQEAQNLITLERNLKEFPRIIIPLPIMDYTTSKILTMDYIQGKNINKLSPLGQIELDGEALAEELFKAYLQQILIDGFFHADPHPGNIYITDTGNLALLDLGMIARVSEKLKAKLIRILIAVSEGDGEKAANWTLAIGEKKEKANEKQFIREVTDLINETSNNTLEHIEVGRLILEITRISANNNIRLPDEVIMLGKTFMNLDRAGRKLHPDFDPNESLRKNAPKLIKKIMSDSFKRGNIYEVILDTKNILENLPARINDILNAMAGNQFTINTKIVDEHDFISGIKESANRLTIGIILAALIIGASLMMRVETSFQVFGYPGLAIVFFLLAAIGGIILILRTLFRH